MSPRPRVALAVVVSLTLLAACDSAEERAEKHFETGLALMEDGDVDRAVVEFRNVLRLDARHKEARALYADLVLEQGKWRDAYRNYLALVEFYPADVEPRITLADMAVRMGRWEDAVHHGNRVIQDAPDDPRVQLISAALDFRGAISRRDDAARRTAAAEAEALVAALEDPSLAREIVIDNYMRDGAHAAALVHVRAAIDEGAETPEKFITKLSLLGALNEDAAFGAALQEAVVLFPEHTDFADDLVAWYIERDATDQAEAFLRDQVTNGPGAADRHRMRLVGFLREMKGDAAAQTELQGYVDEGINPDLFGSVSAQLRFEAGEVDRAIDQMQAIVADAPPGRQTRDIKVELARMLATQGRLIAARQHISEVLAEDVGHVDALKLRAAWLINDDRPDDAIAALRAALDQAPQDAQAMTLMAEAHMRNGNRGLAGEMLSHAVDASGSRAEEALDYARFLQADGNGRAAEAIVVDALQVAPGDTALLAFLGELYVAREDWVRAEQTEQTLRDQATSAALEAAQILELARVNSQQLSAEAISFLSDLARRDGVNGAELAVVRAHFAARDYTSAERFIDVALAQAPERPVMRYLKGSVLAATGRSGEARAIYRALLVEDPTDDVVWRALYATERRDGTAAAAAEVLDDALKVLPEDPNLLWAQAGLLEEMGDYDGAIAVYETLYGADPASPVLANNLASLLSTHRDTPEDLERAYSVAKRLRGASEPAFQDTYGWIAYRRGLIHDALDHLKPAAEALADDPMVIFRLAMAYRADARDDKALPLFERALALAGPDDTRPAFTTARDEIARITSTMAESEAN